jgi:hypothetical protein
MSMATKILQDCGIPLPQGLTCAEFDSFGFQSKAIQENRTQWYTLTDVLTLSKRGLAPTAVGWPWPKPKIYLEAAVCLLPECVEDLKVAEELARRMEQVSHNAIKAQKMAIDKSPLVHYEKRQWYASMQKKLRSLSPQKRRFKGGSSSSDSNASLTSLSSPPTSLESSPICK